MNKNKLNRDDLQRIRRLRLIDDDFMNVCFDGYIKGTELLLRIILNKPDISVKKVITQKIMKNLHGRDIWLDIDAVDASGIEYDIEIQRADQGANVKRARYHSSIMDAHLLQPSDDFKYLPETYVIFITEHDVIGDGLPVYVIERQITDTGKPFKDGEHIIFVNGAHQDAATGLGRLMHDFFCTDANDMNYKELADRVRFFKEEEKGVAHMCKILEDMRREAAEEAAKKAAKEAAQKTTARHICDIMQSFGVTVEKAMDTLKIPQAQRKTYVGLVGKMLQ